MPSAIYFNDFSASYIPSILQEIYLNRIYDSYLEGKKDLIIVDVGANIGLTAYYFKDFGKVYAIEPSKQHLECLEMMIKQNEIKNIEVCPFAISNVNGKSNLNHYANNTAFSLLDAGPKEYLIGKEEVETMTLKKFMEIKKLDKIDLLKLDTEGAEGKITSAAEFTEIAPKIGMIIGEYHDWCGVSQDLFTNTLRDLGYDVKWATGLKASVFSAYRI